MKYSFLDVLLDQKAHGIDNSVYKAIQCDLAYNSNKIEGSQLTHEQTVFLWDTKAIDGFARKDDVIETTNHFRAFDHILAHATEPITPELLKELHTIILLGTEKGFDPRYAIGNYKKFANVITNGIFEIEVTPPELVSKEVARLVDGWEKRSNPCLEDIAEFHVAFERIHPFSDGNGRIGRLLMFKECLRHEITPFIITDALRFYYFRGLAKWDEEHGWLLGTCQNAQETFKSQYLRLAESYAEAITSLEIRSAVADKATQQDMSLHELVQKLRSKDQIASLQQITEPYDNSELDSHSGNNDVR